MSFVSSSGVLVPSLVDDCLSVRSSPSSSISHYLSAAFHCVLQYIFWNTLWLTKYVGRTLKDTYSRVEWIVARDYSTFEDSWWAKVGLHVEAKVSETISFSYTPPTISWWKLDSQAPCCSRPPVPCPVVGSVHAFVQLKHGVLKSNAWKPNHFDLLMRWERVNSMHKGLQNNLGFALYVSAAKKQEHHVQALQTFRGQHLPACLCTLPTEHSSALKYSLFLHVAVHILWIFYICIVQDEGCIPFLRT